MSPTPESRPYLLERVGDAAVVRLYADGFADLPLRERILAYHLYRAAVAGRDIFIDQKYAHSLELRDFLEALYTHDAHLEPETRAALRQYTKRFWINNGPHHAITGRKVLLDCSATALRRAVTAVAADGADLPLHPGETPAALVTRLAPILLDPEVDTLVTNKSPGPGRDILAASANHFYENVTLADIEGFTERYPLNATLVKDPDGTLREDVWRVGWDAVVPPGRYAERIAEVVRHLEAAVPYATPAMARALGLLCHYYRTGDPLAFRAYNVAWLADTESPVDTINGFVEVYVDPRGQKGAWEALVYYNDPDKMHLIQTVAEHAPWFEAHMPYDPVFRKPEVQGISARAIEVLIETGDSGPVGPIGINLPNDQDLRARYGSKSVSIGNVIDAYDRSTPPAARRAFCESEAAFARAERWKPLVLDLEVAMHEVIGHASGRAAADLRGNPEDHIREYYSALEEARADLVALWYLGDPELVTLGLVPAAHRAAIERTAYELYTRQALSQLSRVRTGSTLEEDHMRNRQMIVHWLMTETEAVEVLRRDGQTYYAVRDPAAWRAGVGRLLHEVQRIKSTGDYAAAKALFDAHGVHFDPALRDEVVRRWDALDQPAYKAFVMPELVATRDDRGTVCDVRVAYPPSLEAQMLGWSGRR